MALAAGKPPLQKYQGSSGWNVAEDAIARQFAVIGRCGVELALRGREGVIVEAVGHHPQPQVDQDPESDGVCKTAKPYSESRDCR